jgi:hypothetical protein
MARSCMAPTHTHTYTRAVYAHDHIITCVLGAVAHSCEHSAYHAALHACGAEGRRSCRGIVVVTPPQSCWSAQLLRSCCAAAGSRQSDSDSHTRHTRGIKKRQRCGGADSRSPQSTPLPKRRTAAADAGGKNVSRTRGRERRQHGTDRQRGGKGGSCGEGMAPTAAGGSVSARAPHSQKPASKAAAAHQQTAPAPAFPCCRRCTRSDKMS